MDSLLRILSSMLLSTLSFSALALECTAIDSSSQIVITCTKQVQAIPPIIPPTIPTGTNTLPTTIYTPSNGGTSTSGAANDPGMFTGTWIPEGMTDVWVVDQSETGGVGGTTVIPGCANQKSQLNVCGSSLVETRNGVTTTITMAQGHTMSIRYLSEATVVTGSYFKVSSGTGAGVPAAVQVSLSSQPGDFTGPAGCNKTSIAGGNPLIILNGTNCPVAPNTYYYLNIKTTTACSPTNCTFKIAEPASFTN